MDGFDQDKADGECDEGAVIARGFLAAERDAFEALEFADGLLDARSRFVEDFWEESGSVMTGQTPRLRTPSRLDLASSVMAARDCSPKGGRPNSADFHRNQRSSGECRFKPLTRCAHRLPKPTALTLESDGSSG